MIDVFFSRTGLSPSLVSRSRDIPLKIHWSPCCAESKRLHLITLYTQRSVPLIYTSKLIRRPTALHRNMYIVQTLPFSLATTRGIFSISFPLATEMFHFARSSSKHLCIQCLISQLSLRRVSSFGYLRVTGCLGPLRSFSHPATSFIAFWCQGIHRALLFEIAYNENTQMCFRCLLTRSC